MRRRPADEPKIACARPFTPRFHQLVARRLPVGFAACLAACSILHLTAFARDDNPPAPPAPDHALTPPPKPKPDPAVNQPARASRGPVQMPRAATTPRHNPRLVASSSAADAPHEHSPVPSPRLRLRDHDGNIVIARLHGREGNRSAALLPDGQIGFPQRLIETDEPFRPLTIEALREQLSRSKFTDFQILQTQHYLIFHQSSQRFAAASGKLLEDLYKGLSEWLQRKGVDVADAEFPLVAVIFKTEADFRAYKPVAPQIQAYYDLMSNYIFFYEKSDRDEQAPEIAALRKPQTVAHEGTHQILANLGVQPRLTPWPLWIVEGLAEYCSTPVMNRKGVTNWGGIGLVNPLHLATIRDLENPVTLQSRGPQPPRKQRMPLVGEIVMRTELSPTDYALAWAMTHYLATKRSRDFFIYLDRLRELPPLSERTPAEQLELFRSVFGRDLAKLDKSVAEHLSKFKKYDTLQVYAVLFERSLGAGASRRNAIVSQSPSIIRQWIGTMSENGTAAARWEVMPFPNRAQAVYTAEQWVHLR